MRMLVKLYGPTSKRRLRRAAIARQSALVPRKERIEGNPDLKHVSTSYAERNNLNVQDALSADDAVDERISARRWKITRTQWRYISSITISFASIRRLRTTPAMASGVTIRLWEMNDIVDVLEAWEAAQKMD